VDASGTREGYIVINSNGTYNYTSNLSYPDGNNSSPTIVSVGLPDTTQRAFKFYYTGNTSDLPPGLYQWKIGVDANSPTTSTASITIPLRPPTNLTLAGFGVSNIIARWDGNPVSFPVTYRIYSNGIAQPNLVANLSASIPNAGTIPTTIQVEAVYGSNVSTRTSASISPPPPPANLRTTGYLTVSAVNIAWDNPLPGTQVSYALTYSGPICLGIFEAVVITSIREFSLCKDSLMIRFKIPSSKKFKF
jgi:hypothetical protein